MGQASLMLCSSQPNALPMLALASLPVSQPVYTTQISILIDQVKKKVAFRLLLPLLFILFIFNSAIY
jgi:hypothetical protein